jgi:predicted dehydrogenase
MIRMAILGTGFIANVFMAGANKVPGLEVVAVLAVSEQDGREFCDRYGINRWYMDYDELLSNDDIDLVYVALPNHLHFSFAKRAILAGKSVVVEKPFVASADEACDLMEKARANNVMVFDAITTKYSPLMDVMRENIGQLGAIKGATSTYCQYSHRYDAVRAGDIPGVFRLENDGGALKDLGIYPITLMVSLFGRPAAAHYFANKLPNGCDTSGTLVLVYPTMVATIRIAKDSFTENRCTIEGEDGTFFVDSDCFRFPNVRFRKNAQDAGTVLSTVPSNDGIANEFRRFVSIMENHDYEESYRLASMAIDAVAVLSEAARSASIEYGSQED